MLGQVAISTGKLPATLLVKMPTAMPLNLVPNAEMVISTCWEHCANKRQEKIGLYHHGTGMVVRDVQLVMGNGTYFKYLKCSDHSASKARTD